MQTASGQFVGLLNFKSILHNKAFLLAFTNTGRFVGVCIPVLFVLSLGIAVSLAKQTAYAEILKTGFVEKQLSALKELQSAEGIRIQKLNAEEAEEFVNFLSEADTKIAVEQALFEEILTQAEHYVYGEESLESAVNAIVEKVEIYQAE